MSKRLVPDELWELVAPLPPSFAARPQGDGTAPRDERAVFTAVVYVLTSGCAWRHLPPTFGTSSATAHRRFTVWTEVGLWRRLHRAVLDELGVRGEVDWTSGIVDAASVRARGGKIERSIAWLFGYRRLTIRYERKGSHFLAFLGLAAALTCYKKLAKLAT
ncbi:transposase [Streptomyces sp. LN704]|uniref:transposase n=1 Tax=unclassified Streptomyces TaxID=2593676 RepID=UPI00371B5930